MFTNCVKLWIRRTASLATSAFLSLTAQTDFSFSPYIFSKEATFERADFTLQLLMFVTEEKEERKCLYFPFFQFL